MTSRTSALSRSLRSLVSWWIQYVIPSWRETIWNTTSSKNEKVHVCSHIQLGAMPSQPCSLALKIMTTNYSPWNFPQSTALRRCVMDTYTPPSLFQQFLMDLTNHQLRHWLIMSSFKWCTQHVSLKLLLQGLYRFLDPNYKTFFRLFSKTIIHFQTQGYQKGDQWRP